MTLLLRQYSMQIFLRFPLHHLLPSLFEQLLLLMSSYSFGAIITVAAPGARCVIHHVSVFGGETINFDVYSVAGSPFIKDPAPVRDHDAGYQVDDVVISKYRAEYPLINPDEQRHEAKRQIALSDILQQVYRGETNVPTIIKVIHVVVRYDYREELRVPPGVALDSSHDEVVLHYGPHSVEDTEGEQILAALLVPVVVPEMREAHYIYKQA